MLYNFLSILTLIIALAACATAGNPSVKDATVTSQIKKGSTTKDQLVTLLGKPQVKAITSEGLESWSYAYVETQVTGATFIPVIGIFAGGANSNINSVDIEFDKNNIVKKVTVGQGKVESHNFGKTEQNIEKKEQ